jgi:hypothetical protein
MIYLFFCCLVGLLFFIGYLLLYVKAWQNSGYALSDIADGLGQEIWGIVPGVILWAALGSAFGAIGVLVMINLTDLPGEQIKIWLAVGMSGGLIWGIVWGIIYSLTGQKQ